MPTEPTPIDIDVFLSDWEHVAYVGPNRPRSMALTVGAQELCEPRGECRVRRVWMVHLSGDAALDASGGEFEDYYVEVDRGNPFAVPIWRVETRQ